MNCKIIRENEIHEKYLLDRLDRLEKEDYLHHISDCPGCQKDFENQKSLIAGIRHAGQEQMKQEIQSQVERLRNRSKANWARISRIAAVLFVLILTPSVIYYLQTQEPGALSTAPQVLSEDEEKSVDSPSLKDISDEKQKVTAPSESSPPEDESSKNAGRSSGDIPQIKEKPVLHTQPGQASGRRIDADQKERAVESFDMARKESSVLSNEATMLERVQTDSVNRAVQVDRKGHSLIRGYTLQSREGEVLPEQNYRTKAASDLQKMKALQDRTLKFVSNGHSVIINVYFSASELPANERRSKSFPVELVEDDALQIAMNWLVPAGVFDFNDDLRVELSQNRELFFFVGELAYKVDLNQKITQAVLVE